MLTKEIIIEINPDGTVKMEGKNFQGVECDRMMKKFEEALGVQTEKKMKPEYYQQGQQQKARQ
jgi:hypothetical protein